MSRLDFQFLSGFDQISEIDFSWSSNVNKADWTSFPPLSSLDYFKMVGSRGLNEWTAFPKIAKGLTLLYMYSDNIQDEAMNRILNWAVKYSADTLEILLIHENDLTEIPRQIASFQRLRLST